MLIHFQKYEINEAATNYNLNIHIIRLKCPEHTSEQLATKSDNLILKSKNFSYLNLIHYLKEIQIPIQNLKSLKSLKIVVSSPSRHRQNAMYQTLNESNH